MSDGKLNLAFLWHQHQPFYRIVENGKTVYRMPWVRLHAVKDYYDIPRYLEDFPGIKQNFNLVPSLLAQLEDYVQNRAEDIVLSLTLKHPADLTSAEKEQILDIFFMANERRMIKASSRYRELFDKKEKTESFSEQDFMDLQVWYNLCWIGPFWKSEEPFRSLFKKERDFTDHDKRKLVDGHYHIMAQVLPLYKKLAQEGRIEISVTPFYHPILPLLCDSTVAKEGDHSFIDPGIIFKGPEDADEQVRRAVEYCKTRLGLAPRGMWPSEGSVSAEAMSLIRKNGIFWVATDEGILEHSDATEQNIFLPHTFETSNGDIKLVFRDRALSDSIGFRFSQLEGGEAAREFMDSVESIRTKLISEGRKPAEHLAVVLLDGENCWEYYDNNGYGFLTQLYALLSKSASIRTVTISEFLDKCAAKHTPKITRLHSGSWINRNFRIWIGGHEEENKAWHYLKDTRDFLLAKQKEISSEKKNQAWEEIYISEGSDWFWWMGDDHIAHNKHEFDELFRYHLRQVYHILDMTPPESLYQPIMKYRH